MIAIDIKVGIATVAFNSEDTIAQTIESVLNQTYTNIDYVIVDGLSADRTVEIAQSYGDAFARKGMTYRVVSEKDSGIYDAMNKGVRLCEGDIVGLINSDDWYEPLAAQRAAECFERDRYDLFYADLRIVKSSGDFIKKAKKSGLATTRHWNHPTSFIRREIYDRFQYALETVYDDWDLILRIRKAGGRVTVLNETLASFRFGGVSNEKNWRKMWERIGIKYRIYRKHGYSPLYWLDCVAIELAKYLAS